MKKNSNGLRNLVLITQLGINICVPTFVCLCIGLLIDKLSGMNFFAIIFLVLGILGGGKSAYDFAVKSAKADEHEEEKPEDIVARYNNSHNREGKNEDNT